MQVTAEQVAYWLDARDVVHAIISAAILAGLATVWRSIKSIPSQITERVTAHVDARMETHEKLDSTRFNGVDEDLAEIKRHLRIPHRRQAHGD